MRYYITDIVFTAGRGYHPNIPDKALQKWDVTAGIATTAAGVPIDTFALVAVQQFTRPVDDLVEVDTGFDLIDAIGSNFKFPLDTDAAVDVAFKSSVVARVSPYILDLSEAVSGRDCIRSVGRLLSPGYDVQLFTKAL